MNQYTYDLMRRNVGDLGSQRAEVDRRLAALEAASAAESVDARRIRARAIVAVRAERARFADLGVAS